MGPYFIPLLHIAAVYPGFIVIRGLGAMNSSERETHLATCFLHGNFPEPSHNAPKLHRRNLKKNYDYTKIIKYSSHSDLKIRKVFENTYVVSLAFDAIAQAIFVVPTCTRWQPCCWTTILFSTELSSTTTLYNEAHAGNDKCQTNEIGKKQKEWIWKIKTNEWLFKRLSLVYILLCCQCETKNVFFFSKTIK